MKKYTKQWADELAQTYGGTVQSDPRGYLVVIPRANATIKQIREDNGCTIRVYEDKYRNSDKTRYMNIFNNRGPDPKILVYPRDMRDNTSEADVSASANDDNIYSLMNNLDDDASL
jgi:hypothetical protein